MKKALVGGSGEKKAGFKVHSEPLIPAETNVELSKFSQNGTLSLPSLSNELPISYGTNSIFLIAQAPQWLFTYWDIDIGRHPGGKTFLRCIQGDAFESEIEVPFETRNWYIPVSQPNSSYFVELGYYRGDQWNCIAQSTAVRTHPNQLSSSESFDYATIPLHLNFRQLLERIHKATRSDEKLIQTLARLQKEGQLVPFTSTDLSQLSNDEQTILEFLLEKAFLVSNDLDSLTPSQLQEKIHRYLETRLKNNQNTEAFSSWATATLTSWATTVPQSSDASALGDWQAPSSWTTGDTLSQWGPSETSSWESANTEENGHDFFMHVNAEVVFYGSTDPGSSVTIDSKPVKVNPDGSFRFHFIFPDEAYEAPVIAQSPDGLETRAAVLRFHRTSSSFPHGSSLPPQNGTTSSL